MGALSDFKRAGTWLPMWGQPRFLIWLTAVAGLIGMVLGGLALVHDRLPAPAGLGQQMPVPALSQPETAPASEPQMLADRIPSQLHYLCNEYTRHTQELERHLRQNNWAEVEAVQRRLDAINMALSAYYERDVAACLRGQNE